MIIYKLAVFLFSICILLEMIECSSKGKGIAGGESNGEGVTGSQIRGGRGRRANVGGSSRVRGQSQNPQEYPTDQERLNHIRQMNRSINNLQLDREASLKFSQTVLNLKAEEERNESNEFLNNMKEIADRNNEEMKKFMSEKKDEFLKYGKKAKKVSKPAGEGTVKPKRGKETALTIRDPEEMQPKHVEGKGKAIESQGLGKQPMFAAPTPVQMYMDSHLASQQYQPFQNYESGQNISFSGETEDGYNYMLSFNQPEAQAIEHGNIGQGLRGGRGGRGRIARGRNVRGRDTRGRGWFYLV
uniref:Uncharacterized protein n=1 Tax=Meloidogyne enterolobii TaxID=390850 RepID=A0A6V7V1F3_MELEN|nr:unnamed protein product [Meloidogyne enterolobii]